MPFALLSAAACDSRAVVDPAPVDPLGSSSNTVDDQKGTVSQSPSANGPIATPSTNDEPSEHSRSRLASYVEGDESVSDPNIDGPFSYAEKDATMAVGKRRVEIHTAYPKATGTYPLVVVAHGFQLASSYYYGYLRRLASFGYVGITVDYPTSMMGNDNQAQAGDLIQSINWVKTDSTLGSLTDTSNVGMTGHSLGGKLALLAASKDARVRASIVLDPIDGGHGGCSGDKCVMVANLLPSLTIPTAFLGETTDATGSFQACAPASTNYTTFFAKANAPSFEATVLGANHMSFLDDTRSCGITCSVCRKPAVTNEHVSGLSRAFVVAFYERWLRGNESYDTYLTGSAMRERYIDTKHITMRLKP